MYQPCTRITVNSGERRALTVNEKSAVSRGGTDLPGATRSAGRAHNPKVAGSNPAPATTKALVDGNIRQGFLASPPGCPMGCAWDATLYRVWCQPSPSFSSWWPTFTSPFVPTLQLRSTVFTPNARATRLSTGACAFTSLRFARAAAPATLSARSRTSVNCGSLGPFAEGAVSGSAAGRSAVESSAATAGLGNGLPSGPETGRLFSACSESWAETMDWGSERMKAPQASLLVRVGTIVPGILGALLRTLRGS